VDKCGLTPIVPRITKRGNKNDKNKLFRVPGWDFNINADIYYRKELSMSVSMKTSVERAIKSIREGEYAGRYIKAEFEVNYDRPQTDEECGYCEGSGTVDHYDCDGAGCDNCNDGRVECEDCYGNGYYENDDWGSSNRECLDFILGHVTRACRDATVFSRFGYDGSVDSELMVTVPLSWAGIGYLVEYSNAMVELGKNSGWDFDVKGAGLHLTILRSNNGYYPSNKHPIDNVKWENFKENMTKLMPALLFLASPDHKSRSISTYRRLEVGNGTHGSAIDIASHGQADCFEWRVFETCYNRPEALYDYICTIAKGLEFYSDDPRPVSYRTKVGELEFRDSSAEYGLHKYFQTAKHLQILDEGLKYLKPDHRTRKELYRMRNFTNTRDIEKKKLTRMTWRVEEEYERYRTTVKTEKYQMVRRMIRSWLRDQEYEARAYGAEYPTVAEIETQIGVYRRESNERFPNNKTAWVQRKLEDIRGGYTQKLKIEEV
jgi:hypothetical protein